MSAADDRLPDVAASLSSDWPALLAAKQQGLLESVGSVLAALSRQGYRLADALVAEVLRLAGETGRKGE